MQTRKGAYTIRMATKGTNASKERYIGRQEMAQRQRQTSKGTKAGNERIQKGGQGNAQRQAGKDRQQSWARKGANGGRHMQKAEQ